MRQQILYSNSQVNNLCFRVISSRQPNLLGFGERWDSFQFLEIYTRMPPIHGALLSVLKKLDFKVHDFEKLIKISMQISCDIAPGSQWAAHRLGTIRNPFGSIFRAPLQVLFTPQPPHTSEWGMEVIHPHCHWQNQTHITDHVLEAAQCLLTQRSAKGNHFPHGGRQSRNDGSIQSTSLQLSDDDGGIAVSLAITGKVNQNKRENLGPSGKIIMGFKWLSLRHRVQNILIQQREWRSISKKEWWAE